jgi:UDP-glucose 4-epimerase
MPALEEIFELHGVDAVIHFAALKSVGESVETPIDYYQNNIDGLLSVIKAMQSNHVKKLIFSSSATVYGDPDSLPITEDMPFKTPTNPYGATKQMCEQIIRDCSRVGILDTVSLRYFNPIGAHPSGLIGELPKGVPNNLVPYVTQAAARVRGALTVYGDDYPTPDGSGVRDYIHVVDLAKAHVKALEYLEKAHKGSTVALNIGTGKGSSVLEIVSTFEKVNGVKVPYTVGKRRAGDIAACYASPDKAHQILGWQANLSLEDALKDAWRWQQNIGK